MRKRQRRLTGVDEIVLSLTARGLVFRNVGITRGGAWPWGDGRELRTGDLIRALGQ